MTTTDADTARMAPNVAALQSIAEKALPEHHVAIVTAKGVHTLLCRGQVKFSGDFSTLRSHLSEMIEWAE